MGNISWDSWAAQAAAQIRFKPDRPAVEEELLAHMEDRADALMRDGMLAREAEKAALAAMGDADEVGRALAAVHKSWVGYLWLWSRRVLILCVVVMVWMALGFSERVLFSDSDAWWEQFSYFSPLGKYEEYYQRTELSPDCADKSDGYTFTVPAEMVIARERYEWSEEYEGERYTEMVEAGTTLYLILRATSLLPGTESCTAFRSFYAVDDLGNFYPSCNEADHLDTAQYERALIGNYGQSSLWASDYEAWITSIDPDARWIELRYDREGRDVRLRIDLTGGETV